MAKVNLPISTFEISKRLGSDVLLKKRKEGFTVTFRNKEKILQFLETEENSIIKTQLNEEWELLPAGEKSEWEDLGEEVGLNGQAFFTIEMKKSFEQGFYELATYGATKYNGISLTIYSTIYNVAVYGVNTYGE